MSPSDAAAATPTVALASLTVDEAGKYRAADRADQAGREREGNEETDRAAAAGAAAGAPAGAPATAACLEPSSCSEDVDDSKLAAVRRAAALVRDDRLLEAARVAARAGIAPPVSAMGFFPEDAAASDVSDAATLDRHLPAAGRMSRLIQSLKARVRNGEHGRGASSSSSSLDDDADAAEYGPWLVQGEHMGRRDVSVYYRTDKKTGSKLNARVESPIEAEMLVPFLSVLNESELYASWLPNWSVPRFRVRRSEKLAQRGRVSQVVLVTVDLPWPFSAREVVLDACGVDDIDATGDICVLVRALGEDADGDAGENAPISHLEKEGTDASTTFVVPSVDEADTVRIGFEGGFLFRALPNDWDAHKSAKAQTDATRGGAEAERAARGGAESSWFAGWGALGGRPSAESATTEDTRADAFSDDEAAPETAPETASPRRILVSVQMSVDPKIDFVPAALMNFVTRTVIYTMWCMLLRVAEGVRDGARPAHAEAIAAKKASLYDWTRARARDMVRRVFAE